jgi:dephospho-CoA kinase
MIIGLTGGIASGKSTVARLFREKGALVLDADLIAHRVIAPGKPAFKKAVNYFGLEILNRAGSINRRRLARIVFNSPLKLKKLNALIHPPVIKIINEEVKKWKGKKIIVIDAPLLIEAGLQRQVDKLVVVSVPRSTQIKRLVKRNRLSLREARLRISSQMPVKDKLKLADEVVSGELSLKKFRVRVNQIWKKFSVYF